jgi:hypothetical protein
MVPKTGGYMQESGNIYGKILAKIQKLDPESQLEILEELVRLVRSRIQPKKYDILELKGKEIWNGEDAQEFVERERALWD